MKCSSELRTIIGRAILALLTLALVSPIRAQSTQGNIFGTVTDVSGAAMPGTTVAVTSLDRGTVHTTVTSGSGAYRVTELEPGAYVVSATHLGFAKTKTARIDLAIEGSIQANLAMKAGDNAITVEVNTTQPLLETGSAEISGQVTQEELLELPSVDRNIVSLMNLAPGVTGGNYDPSSPNAGGRVGQITGAEVVSMGTPPVGNSFLIDGVTTNMEFSGTIAARPPMDHAAGFQVQVAQFPADEGRASGAILNMSLKSGTNKFHGSIYGYVQNNATNAQPKNYTTNPAVTIPYHRYQYGADLGGPIKKDKIFFFVGYEGLRQLQSSQGIYVVPAMSEKIPYNQYSQYGITANTPPAAGCNGYYFGATHDALGGSFGGIAIYDPTSKPYGGTATRTAFTNNCIPASYISPTAVSLLQLYPDPNNPKTSARSYVQTVPRSTLGNWETAKGNWTISPKDSIDMHMLRQNSFLDSTALNPSVTETQLAQNGINSGVNYFRTITPTLVNVARVSYTRFNLRQLPINQTNFLSALIPGWPTAGANGIPGIAIQSLTGLAAVQLVSAFSSPFRLIENNYAAQDMMTWQHGQHSFKFGTEYEQIRFWQNRGRSGGGNLTFGGVNTSSSPSTTLADGVPDMLLGLSSSVTANYVFTQSGIGIRTHYIMPFFQDDWRAARNLTINVGLRYDIFTPYHVDNDYTENFDPTTGTVLIPNTSNYAAKNYGFTNGLPAHWAYVPRDQVYKKIYWKSFDPRIGIAWQAVPKLVAHAGFGIYHTPVMGNESLNGTTNTQDIQPSISQGAPFCLDNNHNNWCPSTGFPTDPSGGFQSVLTSQGFVPYYMPRNLPDPYSEKYTLDFQYSLFSKASVAIGYMGSGTRQFAQLYNANLAPVVSTTVALATRQPYPYFGNPLYSYAQTDHTNYNAGYVSLQFQEWHGLQMKSYYTYSKAMGIGTGNDQVLVTEYNPDYDYGPMDYDIRHRWVTTFIYKIPEPKLKFVGAVIGHWDLSGIINLQSGLPFTVTDSSGTALTVGTTGGSGQRPYVLHNPNLPKDKRTQAAWFDKTAFAHTYWCTGAKFNSDFVTMANGLAIGDAANPCAFAIPALVGTGAQVNTPTATHIVSSTATTMPIPFGNEGKNALSGPNEAVFTTAIQRRFLLPKGYITLRLEEYNLFNHANYHNPSNLNFGSASLFTSITSSQTYPRQLQGSLRYDF